MILKLYGHPFSSYTWKALIALYANDTPFAFCGLGGENPVHDEFVKTASPQGKFPVLVDGDRVVFETSPIIEYLHLHHRGHAPLLPDDADKAIAMRMIDRVFDNYVMGIMQESVGEAIQLGALTDEMRARVTEQLDRSYSWIDNWLADYPQRDSVTLIECAAAPSLFYADWVYEIPAEYARLKAWRAHLLALPPVKRCVDDARPYRQFFPLGAPDRD
jgi:glutathione S-transferase